MDTHGAWRPRAVLFSINKMLSWFDIVLVFLQPNTKDIK
jgi:hypothetical protein